MALREQHESEPPIALAGEGLALEENRYRRVIVAGEYDAEHQFLLDNQIIRQQAGYHVLTPLLIQGANVGVLVNRGWIPAGRDRAVKPNLPITQTTVRIIGVVDKFPGVGLKLKGAEIPAPGWPALVQLADSERLSERLGYRLLPYQVLLDVNEGEGYERIGRPASLSPEKNQGYALQWFGFALVLMVLYLWYGIKPKRAT